MKIFHRVAFPLLIVLVLLRTTAPVRAQAPAMPPLPPGLPTDTVRFTPVKTLTDEEKARRKQEGADAAKAASDERARVLAEFQRFRHEPLRHADGRPMTSASQKDERRSRLGELERTARIKYAKDSAEVDAWLRRQGVVRPDLVRDRPVRIENGQPVYLQSRNLASAKMSRTDKVWPEAGCRWTSTAAA